VTLDVNASFTSRLTWNAPAEQIELAVTADPYIQNGPELTQNMDLRVYTVQADGQPSFFGQALDPADPDPIAAIQGAITVLTGDPSMWPAPPDPANPAEEEDVSAVTTYPTLLGNTTVSSFNPLVFNFALVRVTLQGLTDVAENVRVFFRLFAAASTGSTFDPVSLYRSTPLPGGANPSNSTADPTAGPNPNMPSPPPVPPWQTRVPLLGVGATQPTGTDILTIPFLATPRVDATQVPMWTQPPDWPNTQQIEPDPSGEPVYAFFGCWLDINQDPSTNLQGTTVAGYTRQFPEMVPTGGTPDGPYTTGQYQPISWFVRSQHQCIVAEVAYDPLPIPAGAVPGDSDKLAQRNLFVAGGTS
jgi:hypothetical protein